MDTYFVAINGQQQGPYGLAQIEVMMNTGKIKPSDLCWQEGMPAWQPIHSAIPSLADYVVPSDTFNPYAPPQAVLTTSAPSLKGSYGGIGRLAYFGTSFLVGVFNAIASAALKDSVAGTLVALAFIIVASLVIVYQRLKNIGMNPWWCLLSIVPIANFFIAFRCLAFQEGYVETGKMDKAGVIVAWIFGILMALMLVGIVMLLRNA
ncbi:uncharacterized membrane protein YhaH (DUF805 family) [Prosthecobacter fusiformis]|uniref:Uncharacterized membrane protein YhaH (DUF805 family) n=1 Tax=Prosthecobacter fusiformis TaxID=48464 RepID=A0A4R7RMA6_9BACT|nr:GYF domain-containing protein [Prosthecobacter fusiformis]TDU66530.1 uncharacterized membrane protein YhaH (DUF805 family) [Prosthecobacter fusiformis]